MKKNLGQHFLTSEHIAGTAVAALELTSADTVIEIGPGTGILTQKLCQQAGNVIAIEKDSDLVVKIQKTYAEEIKKGVLSVVHDDIRNFDPTDFDLKDSQYKVIGNIPYYISGTILRTMLSTTPQPSQAVFMLQKEVAERIVAKDGKESILSISVKVYGEPSIVRIVKQGSFSPPPRVDSALLNIQNISKDFFTDVDEEQFFEFLRKGFAHKRKLLKNNLGLLEELLDDCNLPKNVRAEECSKNDWGRLFKRVIKTTR